MPITNQQLIDSITQWARHSTYDLKMRHPEDLLESCDDYMDDLEMEDSESQHAVDAFLKSEHITQIPENSPLMTKLLNAYYVGTQQGYQDAQDDLLSIILRTNPTDIYHKMKLNGWDGNTEDMFEYLAPALLKQMLNLQDNQEFNYRPWFK